MWQIEELSIDRTDRWSDPKQSHRGRLVLKNSDGRKAEFDLDASECGNILSACSGVIRAAAAFVGATMQQRPIVTSFPVIEDKTRSGGDAEPDE